MENKKNLIEEFQNLANNPTFRRIGIIILLCVGFWLMIKACSESSGGETLHFRIARDPDWHPIQLYGKEKNMLAFTDDLLFAIAKEKNMRFELVTRAHNELIMGLDKGEYDGMLSSLMPDPFNKGKYDFSHSFYLLGPVLVLPSQTPFESFHDLEGKLVGFRAGTSLPAELTQSKVIFKPYENVLSALDDVDRQRIDGLIMDVLPAQIYTQSFYGRRLRVATKPFTEQGLRLITKKENDKLVQLFNEGLQTLQENGTYEDLLKSWGLVNTTKLAPN